MKEMIDTKANLKKFLIERERWFLDYANLFEELRMVQYINEGLKQLEELDAEDDAIVIMYDKNDKLHFKTKE